MNIFLLDSIPLDPLPDRPAVLENREDESSGGESHGDDVHHCERRREVDRRVRLVGEKVELLRGRKDASVVVGTPEAVKGSAGGYGEVAEVPGLGAKKTKERDGKRKVKINEGLGSVASTITRRKDSS